MLISNKKILTVVIFFFFNYLSDCDLSFPDMIHVFRDFSGREGKNTMI